MTHWKILKPKNVADSKGICSSSNAYGANTLVTTAPALVLAQVTLVQVLPCDISELIQNNAFTSILFTSNYISYINLFSVII